MSTESLLLGVSLYLTLVFNTPFWRALLAGRSAQDGTFTYVLAVGVGRLELRVAGADVPAWQHFA